MPIPLRSVPIRSAVRRWRAFAPPPGSAESPVTRSVDTHKLVEKYLHHFRLYNKKACMKGFYVYLNTCTTLNVICVASAFVRMPAMCLVEAAGSTPPLILTTCGTAKLTSAIDTKKPPATSRYLHARARECIRRRQQSVWTRAKK